VAVQVPLVQVAQVVQALHLHIVAHLFHTLAVVVVQAEHQVVAVLVLLMAVQLQQIVAQAAVLVLLQPAVLAVQALSLFVIQIRLTRHQH
jgi:hypothetical protein